MTATTRAAATGPGAPGEPGPEAAIATIDLALDDPGCVAHRFPLERRCDIIVERGGGRRLGLHLDHAGLSCSAERLPWCAPALLARCLAEQAATARGIPLLLSVYHTHGRRVTAGEESPAEAVDLIDGACALAAIGIRIAGARWAIRIDAAGLTFAGPGGPVDHAAIDAAIRLAFER